MDFTLQILQNSVESAPVEECQGGSLALISLCNVLRQPALYMCFSSEEHTADAPPTD